MRPVLLLTVLATAFQCALADDITFTNRTATFTDLQGRTYRRVQLVRGDLDGLIWRDGASGGRICYTNLSPELLESFGISSNRIEIARARAEKKAIADARYRSLVFAKPQNILQVQPGLTNAVPPSMPEQSGSPAEEGSGVPYSPGYLYPPEFFYGFGPPTVAVSAPSAASSPTAATALSSPSVPSVSSSPGALPSFVPPSTPGRRR
jgi:hypothetical protein